jgi:DNA-binding NarL/FixJ family response regulator
MKKKILVIEDQPQMRRNLMTILKMEGYDPIAAENGALGLASARQHRPALILCDVMMPVLDGHSVLQSVREDDSIADTPFVFITARGEKADQRAGMNLGADDYLTKPVDRVELINAIAARLERRRVQEGQLKSFQPDFSQALPLEALGVSPREAEVLLWIAQGKTNAEIGSIIGATEGTIKKHMRHLFDKLGADSRGALMLLALEQLSKGMAAAPRSCL